VLTQFTDDSDRPTLASYIDVPDVYAAGRLDRDSEGLLLLTNDGQLQNELSHPEHKLAKVYWVQVEGEPDAKALQQLRDGVVLDNKKTLPAQVRRIGVPPGLWPRNPPIRVRINIPDCWLEIKIVEGRNRQVRRMTAAVGHPTLRLIRYAIGDWTLTGLAPGEWEKVEFNFPAAIQDQQIEK